MEFAVLGSLEVRGQGGQPITAPLLRSMLAVLLSGPNRRVSADVLIDALWPDQPGGAEQRLQVLVHRLRRELGDPSRVLFEHGGYVLRVEPGELDAERFESLCRDARAGWDAARSLRTAIGLWRGEAYADAPRTPPVEAEAARLNGLRTLALEDLYAVELEIGAGGAELVTELQGLVKRHPLRERFVALLMVAMGRAGRPVEALEVYRQTRDRFVDELGVEPGADLRRLEREILAGQVPGVTPEPARLVTPAQLPPDVAPFVGRRAELDELDAVLAAGERLAVVSGTAGAGKTALAVHWAHQVRSRFADGQLYLNLRGYGSGEPMTAHAALGALLHSLGVSGQRIPDDVGMRTGMLRTMLADRSMLLVLDNVRHAAQVRPLLPATGFVVVTSRSQLRGLTVTDGARRVALGRFPADAAAELLRASTRPTVGATIGAAVLDELARWCGHLPLALTVAGERLSRRPAGGAVGLIDEIRSAPGLLDAFDDGDPATDLRLIFSWSYRALDPAEARMFRLLGLVPGDDAGLPAVAALAGTTVGAARRSLDRLQEAHLLEQRAPGRFEQHDLLRAYARELADTDADGALDRLFGWYLHSAAAARVAMGRGLPLYDLPEPDAVPLEFADAAAATEWFEQERHALAAAVREAGRRGRHRAAFGIAHMLWVYLSHSHLVDDIAELHRIATDAARQVGDEAALATSASQLGTTAMRLGRYADSVRYAERAAAHWERAGNLRGQAAVRANLGAAYQAQGRYDEALEHQWRGLAIAERAGHPQQQAHVLNNLAMTLVGLGRTSEAVELCRRSLRITEESGYDVNRPHVLDTLGLALLQGGSRDEAAARFSAALEIFRAVGDRWNEALILSHRARARPAGGAREDLVRALRILDEISAADNDELRRADLIDRLAALRDRLV
ncbi:MAG TPA: BTAD domain-containing putative transcriptional regulator [Kribbellaceae bacterium]